MAGIGFELKKLYSPRSIIKSVRAYLFSSIVTIGPMMMCIFMLTFFSDNKKIWHTIL